jgi:hypothetical protein
MLMREHHPMETFVAWEDGWKIKAGKAIIGNISKCSMPQNKMKNVYMAWGGSYSGHIESLVSVRLAIPDAQIKLLFSQHLQIKRFKGSAGWDQSQLYHVPSRHPPLNLHDFNDTKTKSRKKSQAARLQLLTWEMFGS